MNPIASIIEKCTSRRQILLRTIATAAFTAIACALAAAQSLPEVHVDADGLAPRPIEALTQSTIAHHYAVAWSDLASALASDQSDKLSEEFVGFAKDRLIRRITQQAQAGLHVRIVDHGHQLKAVFYSTDGTAMQLIDKAQLEIQTFDGSKLLATQNTPHEYIVIMTPGADRWYVRDLEEVSGKSSEGL